MDTRTAHMLNALNMRFYAENAKSFSQTRKNPWEGWERLSPLVRRASSILDVACGNMRFERYIQEVCGASLPDVYCVDACSELAHIGPEVSFQRLDVVNSCIDGSDLGLHLAAPPCDLVVSFGFLHHVPGVEARHALLRALADKTASGGYIVISFWQFMNDERIAAKAVETTSRFNKELEFELDEGDYLLGWKDVPGACRYCHHFSDGEIDGLAMVLENRFKVFDRFRADGRSAPLNTYLVMQNE